MGSKKVISFIVLLTIILLFTGCNSNLLKNLSGKSIGVYLQIVDDSKYLSIEDKINNKLVQQISKNKDINVVKINSGTMTQNSTYDERVDIIAGFNLDYLLVLNLYDLKYEIDFDLRKTGDFSFESVLIDKYNLGLTYYLYDNWSFEPVHTEDCNGFFSSSRKSNAPVVTSDLAYEFAQAVVKALKKSELSKAEK